jgi:hypothetical protein
MVLSRDTPIHERPEGIEVSLSSILPSAPLPSVVELIVCLGYIEAPFGGGVGTFLNRA